MPSPSAAAKLSREFKLPMADSIVLATARQFNAVLWTQADFEKLPGVQAMRLCTSDR